MEAEGAMFANQLRYRRGHVARPGLVAPANHRQHLIRQRRGFGRGSVWNRHEETDSRSC